MKISQHTNSRININWHHINICTLELLCGNSQPNFQIEKCIHLFLVGKLYFMLYITTHILLDKQEDREDMNKTEGEHVFSSSSELCNYCIFWNHIHKYRHTECPFRNIKALHLQIFTKPHTINIILVSTYCLWLYIVSTLSFSILSHSVYYNLICIWSITNILLLPFYGCDPGGDIASCLILSAMKQSMNILSHPNLHHHHHPAASVQ